MSERQKDLLLGAIVVVTIIAAILIVAQTVELASAIAAIATLVGISLGITYAAILQARRSAAAGLKRITDRYDEIGARALYNRYPEALLELPVGDQERILRDLGRRRQVPDRQVSDAVGILRNPEFQNAVDRIRFVLEGLLNPQADE